MNIQILEVVKPLRIDRVEVLIFRPFLKLKVSWGLLDLIQIKINIWVVRTKKILKHFIQRNSRSITNILSIIQKMNGLRLKLCNHKMIIHLEVIFKVSIRKVSTMDSVYNYNKDRFKSWEYIQINNVNLDTEAQVDKSWNKSQAKKVYLVMLMSEIG